jgi:hypothetical protein
MQAVNAGATSCTESKLFSQIEVLSQERLMRVFLLLICLVFGRFFSYGQLNLSALSGKERPYCSNPDSLALSMRARCEKKLSARIGKKYFNAFYDRNYLYPHYYKNVYYNSAPSERNYRVYFRMYPLEHTTYEFEIPLKADAKTFMMPFSKFLPDCKAKPSECNCVTKNEVLKKGDAIEPVLLKTPGHATFGFDPASESFIWTYQKTERLSDTRAHVLTVVFDANDLSIFSKQLDTNVWMGRCLGKGSLISTPPGLRKVEDLQEGDTILAKGPDGKPAPYVVIKTSRKKVLAPFNMLVYSEQGKNIAFISPAHPDENGIPCGKTVESGKGKHPILINYLENFTYDILTNAPNGGYFCGELYLRSTIEKENDL